MGFYGNITNTNKTQFTFDRTYPRRQMMDANVLTDNVFVGRYVLVEYDLSTTEGLQTGENYFRVYISDGKYYSNENGEDATRIRYAGEGNNNSSETSIAKGKIVYTLNENNKKQFYVCIGDDNKDEYADFMPIVNPEDKSSYITNYEIDEAIYSDNNNKSSFRGYDSTVWQKVLTEGSYKYVNIAELNSVVPTFEVAVDAPTMTPIQPHFDTESNNVYYKLHVQPQWGFRVKEAEAINEDGEILSDEMVKHESVSYNPSTGDISKSESKVKGDIYFNKAAFDPQINKGKIKKHDDKTHDTITILPTGKSENIYNDHLQGNDIQELTINLPSIGNMMSDAWDIIHGPYRNDARTDDNGSLQGRLDSFKDMPVDAIPVKRNPDGTLVASYINGNTKFSFGEGKNILNTEISTDIGSDDAWIYTNVYTENLDNDKNKNGIAIHHKFTQVNDTATKSDKNGGELELEENVTQGENHGLDDTLKLYTPKVDKAGHVVGNNIETVTLPFGFKTVTTNGRGTNVETNQEPESGIAERSLIVANDTHSILTVDSGNEWIKIDTDATKDSITFSHDIHTINTTQKEKNNLDGEGKFTVQDLSFDAAGHVTANQSHTYQLPNAFRNIKISIPTEEDPTAGLLIEADSYNDTTVLKANNRWIVLSGDVDENTIGFEHAAAGDMKFTAGDKDDDEPSFNGTFTVPYINYEEKGHVVDWSTKTVTIPQGSLNDQPSENVSNVLTSIKFTPGTGAIVTTHENVGTLTLSGYSTPQNSVNSVSANDTVNGAIGKLQKQITDEVSENRDNAITNAINALNVAAITTDTGKVFSSISETGGKINASTQPVSNLTLSNYSENSDDTKIKTGDTLNAAFGKLENQVDIALTNAKAYANDIKTELTSAIENIKDSYLTPDTEIVVHEDEQGQIKNSVKELLELTYTLNNTIAILEDRIATLEGHHSGTTNE